MSGHEAALDQRPFIILVIMFLAWLNYRGVLATLTFNLVITAIAFVAILVLFLPPPASSGGGIMEHAALFEGHELPYGWIGVLAAMHFGLWYLPWYRRHDAGRRGSPLSGPRAAVRHAGRDHDAADRGDADLVHLLRRPAVGVPGRWRQRLGGTAV